MWKGKFGKSAASQPKNGVKGERTAKIYVGEATAPTTPPPAEAKPTGIQARNSKELQDWQLDSSFDSKNLTSTRDIDGFMASLSVRSIVFPRSVDLPSRLALPPICALCHSLYLSQLVF